MSDFKIHILGCGSALPTQRHLPTSQVVELRGKLYLIDCGEGTQRQIRAQGLSFGAIRAIFITHHHGDHVFGLPGLLSSLSMLGRRQALTLVGPRGTKGMMAHIQALMLDGLQYPLIVEEYDDRQVTTVFDDRSLLVESIPLKHRIPCQGYLFREKVQVRHIDRASCDFYGVPRSYYPRLLAGEDWQHESGQSISNARLTRLGHPARSYAMCSDTCYIPELAEQLRGVSALYHETTFLRHDAERAKQTCHTMAYEAATLARDAAVNQLIIGHYSARYSHSAPFLEEAKAIYPNVIAADEGLVISL